MPIGCRFCETLDSSGSQIMQSRERSNWKTMRVSRPRPSRGICPVVLHMPVESFLHDLPSAVRLHQCEYIGHGDVRSR